MMGNIGNCLQKGAVRDRVKLNLYYAWSEALVFKYRKWMVSGMAALLLLTGCSGGGSGDDQPEVSADVSAAVSAVVSVQEPEKVAPEQPAASAPEGPADPMPEEPVELGWSWFDDAVMIGDSVSLKLKNHVTKTRQTDPEYFGQGQFLTSGSLGSGNALWEVSDKSVHPAYQGEKMLLEESIPLTGAKKVYMMLGTNDIAVYGIEGAVENYGALLDKIAAAVPDAEFYIQSATPICEGAEVGALTNENLEAYNLKLAEMCQSRGVRFVDVASVMRDENGYLPRNYCSDPDGMGIHLTDEGCLVWLEYLLADAAAQ